MRPFGFETGRGGLNLGTDASKERPHLSLRVFSRKIDELGPDLAVEIADLLDCRDTRVILR
jgi:hypothetical protein